MNLSFYTYQFPFEKPFQTARHHFKNREGVYISLQKDGITILSEAAPLPDFSAERLSTVLQELQTHSEHICAHFFNSFSLDGTNQFIQAKNFSPSLQFGLYTLAAGYLAQKNQSSLQNFLFADAPSRIPLNAIIGRDDISNIKKINQLITTGYKTIKIKAGKVWQEIIPVIEKVRSLSNSINIRIDANQSWTMAQAKACLHQLESYNIEYCEEPLAQPETSTLTELCDTTSVPIALDESLLQIFSLKQALELAPVLIIKPMVLGMQVLTKTFRKKAKKHESKLVFTTSLESGIGRLVTAALAAGIASPGTAHGLATGQLLADDIWKDDAFISNGYFSLPDTRHFVSLMNTSLTDLPVQKVWSYE